ncbi:high-affinity branched-chain amino acid ABC transporter permease LivM [Pokkaliibacter sp. MBI-7]|uniref:Branched-chain amino acid ABC transporter permease n=1 Tax=Proteobacteria bacterium 228 TaxID=2083153 RepID=A0A2S5KW09_9PROT|nr:MULTISPECIES: high-affinity branched-chain amino acid ABC transporter permease LivM [Pokkaliibacter]MDH2431912.1 high-affinity branched-chain amino acid ABC transporter permease LivM [Pokkaliibacter sp. MBI-7]PPC79034.1 branched-chain amino acid ABC transporter permease [Pokkaliibacter plantistimulans]
MSSSINIKKSVIDTLLAGLLSLIVFGPVIGILLDGYDFTTRPSLLLTMVGIVMVGRFAISLFVQSKKGQMMLYKHQNNDDGVIVLPPGHKSKMIYIVPIAIIIGLVAPFVATKYILTVLILGLIYVLLGLGLNIVVGLAGLLDLGFVGFYAIGAYGLSLGYQYLGFGFWSMLPLAAIMAAVAGAILGFPVLRMHGDYLAIVTLGFGEIIRLILTNWTSFTGGPNGVYAPLPTLFGLEFERRAKQGGTPFHEFFNLPYDSGLKYVFIYLSLFMVVCAVLYIKHRLVKMPIGRAWEALREDEIACRSLGLNHVLIKLSAFMMGASTGGLAGVFFATYQGFVNPTSFTFFESALILAIVVLGGLGSTVGVVIAAFVLTVTPEMLREVADFRVLIFGLLMVVMMIWRPRGLVRITRTGFAVRKGVA